MSQWKVRRVRVLTSDIRPPLHSQVLWSAIVSDEWDWGNVKRILTCQDWFKTLLPSYPVCLECSNKNTRHRGGWHCSKAPRFPCFVGLNLFPMWSFLVLHFPLCCGNWLHSFRANEDHLSRQHILQGRDKEITKIFTSQSCSPSTGTRRDVSVQVLFLTRKQHPWIQLTDRCHLSALFSYIRRVKLCIKILFSPSSLTWAATGEQDRMRQAVLGAWALFNQLQT